MYAYRVMVSDHSNDTDISDDTDEYDDESDDEDYDECISTTK